MLTCRDIAELCTDRAEGNLDEDARAQFDHHLSGCPSCHAYARQLGITAEALQRLPEPEAPPELQDALLREFDRRIAARAAPRGALAGRAHAGAAPRASFATPFAVLAALAGFLGVSSHPTGAGLDWVVAASLAAAALGLATVASRFTPGSVVGGIGAAAAAALAAGGRGPVDAHTGLHCLGAELAAAGFVVAATWLAARSASGPGWRWSVAVGATVGALAGDAVLQVACPSRSALPHLLVFHVGGVLLAGAAALWALRGRGRLAGA